jgi:esterase/lipase superfamily enzyme
MEERFWPWRTRSFGRRRMACVLLALPLIARAVGSDFPTSSEERETPPVAVGVRYLTNRTVDGDGPQGVTYGGGRGSLRFGLCEVQFTAIPLLGDLAQSIPFYVPAETKRVRATERSDAAAFWDELGAASRRTATGSVVLFVHGYSNAFERACRMAAELQRVLEDQATVLLFSWPSGGRPLEYSRDQADLEWSVPLLAEILAQLDQGIGWSNVQILAHSLGSRGIIFALEWLGKQPTADQSLRNLVLLAPDFDAQAFPAHLPRISPLTRAITLYASANDSPLAVSQQLHGAPRLGQGGDLRTVVAGVETIDVSPAGRNHITGHEYFYRHPKVAADLVRLLVTGERADQRPGLKPEVQSGVRFWALGAKSGVQAGP